MPKVVETSHGKTFDMKANFSSLLMTTLKLIYFLDACFHTDIDQEHHTALE